MLLTVLAGALMRTWSPATTAPAPKDTQVGGDGTRIGTRIVSVAAVVVVDVHGGIRRFRGVLGDCGVGRRVVKNRRVFAGCGAVGAGTARDRHEAAERQEPRSSVHVDLKTREKPRDPQFAIVGATAIAGC